MYMKRICFVFISWLLCTGAMAQSLTGTWQGNLAIRGRNIPILFHITKDAANQLNAKFDSPRQGALDLACDGVSVVGDSLLIKMKIINGRYAGKLSNDKKQLTGNWYQGVTILPLNLSHISDSLVRFSGEIKRSQTPKPPLPYKSEDVEYDNADKSVHFGATLTVPLPDSGVNYFRAPVYPTIVLITGSGKQDRDETIFDHKPFAVIADHLSRNGFAVLRVDDREAGKTTGNFNASTTADFAKDVETAITYLKTRKEVDTNYIGLLGHSEGGMIAPMVAAKRNDIKFIVLLAGPGVKTIDLMEQQTIDVMASDGRTKEDLEKYRPLYKELVTYILTEKDSAKIFDGASAIFKAWQKKVGDTVVKNTTGVTSAQTLSGYLTNYIRSLRSLSSPWFNFFMQFDPVVYLSQVKCPVLALNGSRDIQVSSKANLAGIEQALKAGGNQHYIVKEMPGLNHLFQHCHKCTVAEYEEMDETFSPEVLGIISSWLKENIK